MPKAQHRSQNPLLVRVEIAAPPQEPPSCRHRLVEDDGGCDADVERLHKPAHGHHRAAVCRLDRLLRDACAGHIRVPAHLYFSLLIFLYSGRVEGGEKG